MKNVMMIDRSVDATPSTAFPMGMPTELIRISLLTIALSNPVRSRAD
jgi:hypothetical protein